MRIFHVTDVFAPGMGGIEAHVARLAEKQVEAGHEVTVLTATMEEPRRGTGLTRAELKVRGDNTPYALVRAEWPNPLKLPVAFGAGRKFEDWLDERRAAGDDPIAVHMHLGEVTPGVISLLSRLTTKGYPVVVTVHSVWQRHVTVPLYRLFARFSGISRAPYLWAPVSPLVEGRLREAMPNSIIRTLPNGVDLSAWRRDPVEHEGLVAVTATRFAPRKRVVALLNMLRKVGRQLGQNGNDDDCPQLKVVIAGTGLGLRFARAYVERTGMSSWVELPGRLSQEELKDLYSKSDVYLAPGVDDAFSVSGIEARAAGLAILTRAQSGFGADLESGAEGEAVSDDTQMGRVLLEWVRGGPLSPVSEMKEHNLLTDYRHSWEHVIPANIRLYEQAGTLLQNGS